MHEKFMDSTMWARIEKTGPGDPIVTENLTLELTMYWPRRCPRAT